MKTTEEIIQELKKLTNELYYLSETDAPFTVESWYVNPESVEEEIMKHLPQLENPALEKTELDYLFRNAVKVHEVGTEGDVKTANRFQELVKYLKDTFAFVLVYRAGKIQIHIFIICQAENQGEAIVLKTMAVET
ncbi:MAG: nuclease A inhibitor family protein [Bacteroidia bacterium]